MMICSVTPWEINMPTDAPVQFTAPNLDGYCFTNWTQLFLDAISRMTGYLPGTFALPVFGDSTPSVDDRDKFWVRTIASRFDAVYTYDPTIGLWTTKFYPDPDAGAKVQIYTQDPANIPTLDGGTAGAVTAYTGPFWQIATEFAARFPIGLGTLPSGLAITNGLTGGEETHKLIASEMPVHTHQSQNWSTNSGGAQPDPEAGGDNTGTLQPGNVTTEAGGDAAHNTMPPYVGVTFIRRTARIYKTLPG